MFSVKIWAVKIIFLGLFFISFGLGFNSSDAGADSSMGDRPAIHGMLLVGAQTLYLSHLPMFHSPHDYQVVLEVTFGSRQTNPQAAYVRDRMMTHERVYTLVPDQAFVLPSVVGQKTSFSATVFRGHFERGGVAILKGVVVNIQKVVYFHKFNPATPPLGMLRYFLFGKGRELYLAHLIAVCPDFDQVLAVATADPVPPAGFAAPILLSFPGRSNSQPLREGEVANAQVGNGLRIEAVKVLGQFYHETGDLSCMMN